MIVPYSTTSFSIFLEQIALWPPQSKRMSEYFSFDCMLHRLIQQCCT